MEEKQANLLSNLETAHDLIHRIDKLKKQRHQLTAQKKKKKDEKGHRVRKAIIAVVLAWMIVVKLHEWVNMSLSFSFWGELVFTGISLVLLVALPIVLYKILGIIRTKINIWIEEYNQKISQKIEPIDQEISALQKQWNAKAAPWYPKDYANVEAVDFFLSAARNHRVDSIKEAINLWEEERHQRRMEQGQKEMIAEVRRMRQTQQETLSETKKIEKNTNWEGRFK